MGRPWTVLGQFVGRAWKFRGLSAGRAVHTGSTGALVDVEFHGVTMEIHKND